MTNDGYYVAVAELGLKPTNVPHVFRKGDNVYNVKDGRQQTPDQRVETIEQLKKRLGV
jgi:hypothetical protein